MQSLFSLRTAAVAKNEMKIPAVPRLKNWNTCRVEVSSSLLHASVRTIKKTMIGVDLVLLTVRFLYDFEVFFLLCSIFSVMTPTV